MNTAGELRGSTVISSRIPGMNSGSFTMPEQEQGLTDKGFYRMK